MGDIILKFNGQEIERTADLPRLVGATAVGSKAVVTVWRRGQQQDIPVNIVQLDEEKGAAAKPATKKPKAEQAANALGLHVADLPEATRKDLKIETGVLVEGSEGAAARAGLRAGDLILQLNNAEVQDARQFNAMVSKLDPKKSVAVLVRRDENTQIVVIRPRD